MSAVAGGKQNIIAYEEPTLAPSLKFGPSASAMMMFNLGRGPVAGLADFGEKAVGLVDGVSW